MINCTVSGNTVSGHPFRGGAGGGVSNEGTATLTNCTVTGNTVSSARYSSGGGVYNASTLTLQSSLISGNTADTSIEVFNNTYYGGTITADSSNLFGHSGETSAEAFSDFTPGSNDINATSNGDTPTALDAILDTTLAENDNPAQTYSHALVAGSPAIDLDEKCSAGLEKDQRYADRPVDLGCDAGAYEFNGVPTGVNDIDDDFILDLYDNCPYIYNPRQEDSDGDKVGDACDNCPLVPNCTQKDNNRNNTGNACEQGRITRLSTVNLISIYKLLLLQN
ncbi:MAG: hypothetical protein D3916_17780 [Candidatus Electrothrix sp. MAN1_4]|nr:hypothetical protein [Candidatus Electrothrix sp. MAN1_4]